jgi:hypothetical protein
MVQVPFRLLVSQRFRIDLEMEHFQADWNRGEDPNRHGPAYPGHLSRQGAGRGGPDKPGHDGVAASAAFPVSPNTL